MKTLIIILSIAFSFVNIANAGNFNYGNGTYEQYDDILVVNSLGDELNISTYKNLGANDFIPENAFKNQLGYEGYTMAYDYNPNYSGLYSGIYETKLPTDIELTKIQIGGLAGNPRALQDIYVLTEEYNRLSARGQANNIDILNTSLSSEINNRIIGDNNLGKQITKETNQRKKADTKLNNKITKETKERKYADKQEKTERISGDKQLQKNINTETKERKNEDNLIRKDVKRVEKQSKSRDNVLQNNIDNEVTTRLSADNILQGNINDMNDNSINRDNNLQENINNEETNRINGDNFLNGRINDTNTVVTQQGRTLQDHENRINELEKTQYVIEGGTRIIDTKKYEVISFIRYNETRNIIDTVGIRIIFKIGQSYEETLINKQNNRLSELERKLSQAYTIEKVYDTNGQLKSERISVVK